MQIPLCEIRIFFIGGEDVRDKVLVQAYLYGSGKFLEAKVQAVIDISWFRILPKPLEGAEKGAKCRERSE
jgi:hypothetical protein